MEDEVTGKAKGGIARAAKLTPEERSDIAQKAAIARWGSKPPQAIRKGNFKEDFGIDVECYVLNDDQNTAVISQRGMGAALGLSPQSGARLPRVVSGKTLSTYIGPELKEKLNNPLIFQGLPTVQGEPSLKTIHGFDVTLLIDVCKAIIAADAKGKLSKSQQNMVKQAHIILNASAKAGIKGLVYALTGYDATKEQVIAAFKFFVRQEAREYEKEFPDQLYEQWYRLYDLPKPERNKPWKFKHLTVNHVYVPLAKSNGKIHELVVTQRAASGEKRKRLHQFLADIGVKALRTHLGQLLGIAQVSKTKKEYEKHVNTVFGEQQEFDFDDLTSSI
ncbi:MAG: P63C domain-containing protein [Deltaproteobacteria bacterium]